MGTLLLLTIPENSIGNKIRMKRLELRLIIEHLPAVNH